MEKLIMSAFDKLGLKDSVMTGVYLIWAIARIHGFVYPRFCLKSYCFSGELCLDEIEMNVICA